MNYYKSYYESLKDSPNRRFLKENAGGLLDFSTNDYLNLSHNPELLQAAIDAGKKYGCGATGSRLLSGNHRIFQEFEAQIARDKRMEAALIFVSGYQANLTILSALCNRSVLSAAQPLLIFDKLNHASLYGAAQLSNVRLERYAHNNMKALEAILQKYNGENFAKIIVSETVFGMDGDLADVQTLINLSKHYGAILYLDEAHGTGMFGSSGYGLSTNFELEGVETILMGTFSKALGCSGAYVACSIHIRDYLLQKCSGFIYSTAPSPLVIGAAKKSWKMIGDMQEDRKRTLSLAKYLRENLVKMDLDALESCSHIVPIKMKSSSQAMDAQNFLRERGILLSAVRQPTVSVSRLRVAICSNHSANDVDRLLSELELLQKKGAQNKALPQ